MIFENNKTYFSASVWLEALREKQTKQTPFVEALSPVLATVEQAVASAYQAQVQPEVNGESDETSQIRAIHSELAQFPILATV